MQVGELEDIHRSLQEMERVSSLRHEELQSVVIELKHSHQDQRMNTNERNEARFSQLKEILEEKHARQIE